VSVVDYASSRVPKDYKCGKCRAHGVKLWREYQTFCPALFCGPCAMRDQKEAGAIDDDGRIVDGIAGRTDAIGWLVPCVPTEENDAYWGYTSVHQDAINWWRRLPTLRR